MIKWLCGLVYKHADTYVAESNSYHLKYGYTHIEETICKDCGKVVDRMEFAKVNGKWEAIG